MNCNVICLPNDPELFSVDGNHDCFVTGFGVVEKRKLDFVNALLIRYGKDRLLLIFQVSDRW